MIPDDFDDEPVEVRMTIAVDEEVTPGCDCDQRGNPDPGFHASDCSWRLRDPALPPLTEEQRLAHAAQQMVEQARAFLVTDPASYQRAGEMIDQLKRKKLDVVGWFEPMVSAANKAWKALTTKRASVTEPLDEAIWTLTQRYSAYFMEERRRANAERLALEREAQERERARLQAEADQLAQESADARAAAAQSTSTAESDALTRQAEQLAAVAEATRVEAATVEAPVIAVRSRLADVKGPTVAAHWTFEVFDKRALVAAVAADEVSQEAVEPSDTYLGQFARANKGTAKIPGVRFYDAGTVRGSQPAVTKNRAELIADAAALLGLEPDSIGAPVLDTVGWMVTVGYTVRGAGHLCIECHPTQPTGMAPVYRQQLAATEPCRLCGRRLDEIHA